MIAFCHTYKTAGTSFNTILRDHFGWKHFDSPGFQHQALTAQNLKRLKWVYPKLQSICGHTIKPYSDLQTVEPDLQFYTFFRDPLARSISHITWFLRWKANDGVFFDDFDELVNDWAKAKVNRNRQCRQLSGEGTFEGVKKIVEENPFLILRVGKFDESLFLFRQWVNEPSMDLHYTLKNTGADRYERLQFSHPEYLDKVREFQKILKEDVKKQAVIREANQEDQKLADWVKEVIWPKQVAAYSGDLKKEAAQFKEEQKTNTSPRNEPILPRLHRNLLFKPVRRLLLPVNEPESARNSPWL